MSLSRDEYLANVMGYRLHDCQINPDGFYCTDCEDGLPLAPDFSAPDGFFVLWIWMKQQTWWNKFWSSTFEDYLEVEDVIDIIDPDKLANAVYNFLAGDPE